MEALRKGKTRVLFAQWREVFKHKVKSFSMYTDKAINQLVKERSKVVNLVQKRIEEQLIQSRNYHKLYDTYIAWKSFIEAQKTLQVKIKTYRKQEIERAKARSIRLWSNRNTATQKFKSVKSKVDKVYQKSLIRSCFEGIRYYNQINKGLSQSLSSMAIMIDKVFLQRAFRQIQTEA